MDTSFEINRANTTTTWLTPIEIINALGSFDLDPCTPPEMPWKTAEHRYTEEIDGLIMPWFGRVWLNPPYGKGMDKWLKKMAEHGNGVGLYFNRLESNQFHDWVFPFASGLFFKKQRIYFKDAKGQVPEGSNGPGTGSVFVSYGLENAAVLKDLPLKGIQGKFIPLH